MDGTGDSGSSSGSSKSDNVSTTTTEPSEPAPTPPSGPPNQNDEPPAPEAAAEVPEITTKCTVCAQLTDKMCGHCGKEYYCSKKCQKVHRAAHKPDCYPAQLIKEGDSIPYLVTTRPIQEGELIFEETHLLRTPASEVAKEYQKMGFHKFPICISCTRNLSLPAPYCYQCPQCKWEVCENCVQVQSIEHFVECKLFKLFKVHPKTNEMPHYDLVAAVRCFLWKSLNPTKWAQLLNMVPEVDSPMTDWKKEEEQGWKDNLYNILHLDLGFPITESEFNHWFQVFKTRRVRPAVCVHTFNTYVLPYLSTFIGHSCLPNTQTVYGMEKSTTIASCKIAKGARLTDATRTPHCLGFTLTRRTALEDRYGIECKCERCTDPSELGTFISAIKCPGQNGKGHEEDVPENVGYLLPIDSLNPNSDWSCNFCGLNLPVSEIMEKLSPMFQDMNAYEKQCNERRFDVFMYKKVGPEDDQLIHNMENYVEVARKTLHPNHYIILTMEQKILAGMSACLCTALANRDPASEFYTVDGRLRFSERMETIAKHCLDVTKAVMPGMDFFTGKMLYFYLVANLAWLGDTLYYKEHGTWNNESAEELWKTHNQKIQDILKPLKQIFDIFKHNTEIEMKYRNACVKEYKMVKCIDGLVQIMTGKQQEIPNENTEKVDARIIDRMIKQIIEIGTKKGSETAANKAAKKITTKKRKNKNKKK